MFAIRTFRGVLLVLAIGALLIARASVTSANAQARTIDSWLDFKFDSTAPLGDPRNPAGIVLLSNEMLCCDAPGARRDDQIYFKSASELQAIARTHSEAFILPALFFPSNVKSFDGFNAIDLTVINRETRSEFIEFPAAAARKANPQNLDEIKKLLHDGDIVLGSYAVNSMMWGRYNHVAIVFDAQRDVIAEARSALGSERPGVGIVNWKSFAERFTHIGVVRVKGLTTEQFSRIKKWIALRNGRPYRRPLFDGLDKTDQSHFYSSQLVWLAFHEVLNLDLDHDKGVVVFPDDIYYSRDYVDVIVP